MSPAVSPIQHAFGLRRTSGDTESNAIQFFGGFLPCHVPNGFGRGAAPVSEPLSLLGERRVRRGMKRSFAPGGWSEGPRGQRGTVRPKEEQIAPPHLTLPSPPWGGEGSERPLPKNGMALDSESPGHMILWETLLDPLHRRGERAG